MLRESRHLVSLVDGYAFDLDQGSYCKINNKNILEHQVSFYSCPGFIVACEHVLSEATKDTLPTNLPPLYTSKTIWVIIKVLQRDT